MFRLNQRAAANICQHAVCQQALFLTNLADARASVKVREKTAGPYHFGTAATAD
jgi:hypothetical protein